VAYDVRALTPDDQPAAWELGALAFGYGDRTRPDGWTSDTPGRHTWGVFDDGVLVAKAVDREQGHWFGGRSVPACGVAGVAVATERRGEGLARVVLTRLLAGARERGAVVSTLFPTTPVPYRQLGWEECGAIEWTAVPTATLAAVRMPPGVRLRAAKAEDEPALRELYGDLGRAGTAMLDRCGPAWARGVLDDYDGVSMVEDAEGRPLGYASWDREAGYRETGMVTVDDFVVTTPVAAQALLSMLGGWAAVAPTIRMKLSTVDAAVLASTSWHAPVVDRRPWMLRLVDAAGAVAARGWSPHLSGAVSLELLDEECPWNAGPHRLVLEAGQGRLEPGGPGGLRLTPRGLALWYAGAASPDLLRRAGLLAGAEADGETLLQVATAGPLPQLLDYF
jgi:predicted acetyltransferase